MACATFRTLENSQIRWCIDASIPKAFANSSDDLAFREVQKGIRKCARNKWFSGLLKSGKVLVSRWIYLSSDFDCITNDLWAIRSEAGTDLTRIVCQSDGGCGDVLLLVLKLPSVWISLFSSSKKWEVIKSLASLGISACLSFLSFYSINVYRGTV